MSDLPASTPTICILLVEDSDIDAELIGAALRRAGLRTELKRVETRTAFEAALQDRACDVVLSDYSLPGFDGLTALRLTRERWPDVPFIIVSGVLGEEFAVDALKAGATDYVLKPRLERLPSAVLRAFSEAHEREERRRAEARLQLLVAELSHRVKNTLASVATVARMTLRRSTDLKSFETAFMGRLKALADAHALIFQAKWGETDIRRVLDRVLAPYAKEGSPGFSLSGPPLKLPPKAALAIALIAYELATNAAKYGALSREGGRIDLQWTDRDGRVQLTWREVGGPQVAQPGELGFGAELIARTAQYELDGSAHMSFEPTGLVCRLDFPAGSQTEARPEMVLSA